MLPTSRLVTAVILRDVANVEVRQPGELGEVGRVVNFTEI